jgi:hypothetical protein
MKDAIRASWSADPALAPRDRGPAHGNPGTVRDLAREVDPRSYPSIAGYGRIEQSRLENLVVSVMAGLESGRALRERIRRDAREMARLEPRLPRVNGSGSGPGLFGFLLDVENRLSNHCDRVQARLDGLVPRLNDDSQRLLLELERVERLAARVNECVEHLEALVEAAAFRRDELVSDERPPAIPSWPDPSGRPDRVREIPRPEQLERLDARVDNLRASLESARQLVERLRVTRHDLERLYEHLQTGLYDLLPRWHQRLQDAIVEARRRQTAEVGRQIARSIAAQPPAVVDAAEAEDAMDGESGADTRGGLRLVAPDDPDSREGRPRRILDGSTRRLVSHALSALGRRARAMGRLPSMLRSSDLWWS